jgi:hypothetical protein
VKTPDRIAWDMANEPWNAERILIDALTEREAAAYAQGRAEALEEAAWEIERRKATSFSADSLAAAIRALKEPRR